MRNLRFYVSISFFFILFTISNSFAADPVWLNQYFPLNLNNYWEYSGAASLSMSVDEIRTINDVRTRGLYRSDQDAYIFFSQDEEGLRRHRQEAPALNMYTTYEPPWRELPANAFIGNEYSFTSTHRQYTNDVLDIEVDGTFTTDVLGFEEVNLPVPATINGIEYDSFPDCLMLYHEIDVNGFGSQSETTWYAKDLGIVKVSGDFGTIYLDNASTYYDSGLGGLWLGRILDSNGQDTGDISITLSQNGSSLTGNVDVDLDDGNSYALPITNGYASGPNAVVAAGEGTNSLDFALTHNGNSLTGPYNSSFMGYGTIDPQVLSPVNPSLSSSGSSGGGDGGGGCFIATAAYGSYLHPKVNVLKDFRDKHLLTTRFGKSIVSFYYKTSPPIADFIREHESIRTITRIGLTPIIFAVMHPGLSIVLLLIIISFLGFIILRRQCIRKLSSLPH